MQQKVITIAKRFQAVDQYYLNIDSITKDINDKGWIIKQIISTSFEHQPFGQEARYPVLAVTLLIEHP